MGVHSPLLIPAVYFTHWKIAKCRSTDVLSTSSSFLVLQVSRIESMPSVIDSCLFSFVLHAFLLRFLHYPLHSHTTVSIILFVSSSCNALHLSNHHSLQNNTDYFTAILLISNRIITDMKNVVLEVSKVWLLELLFVWFSSFPVIFKQQVTTPNTP